MGEYAEMAIENELSQVGFGGIDFRIWECRDGRVVSVCDMADSHLKNTIAMLERKACGAFGGWLEEMRKELAAREKGAA